MFFAVKALFCLCACVRASGSFCLKSTCWEKGLTCSKRASSLELSEVSPILNLFFYSKSKWKKKNSDFIFQTETRGFDCELRMKRMRCWIKQFSFRLFETKTRTNLVLLRAIKQTAMSKIESKLFQIYLIWFYGCLMHYALNRDNEYIWFILKVMSFAWE